MTRVLTLLGAALAVGATLFIVLGGDDDAPSKQARQSAPNVIVIMTDDQALNTWNRQVMPKTFKWLEDGTRFTQGFAVPPLCCPARASLMTGRYPHNHGVLTNNYNAILDPADVLPVWLSDAGYETMIAGKFLNGYERVDGANKGFDPAPGWDRWWVAPGEERKYFDYTVSDNGDPVSYGTEPDDYVTAALTEAAVGFMESEAGGDSPYFLWMAHLAPHFSKRERSPFCPHRRGAIPLARDFYAARDAEMPTGPSFFEQDVFDKPGFIRRLDPRNPEGVSRLRATYRCSVASLAAVDRSVGEVFKTLKETGELENSLVFFTSDNGAFFGEHRKREGKKIPYDPAARVPFAVRFPGNRKVPEVSQAQMGTIDIAPTILELAGLEAEHRTDGRSLVDAIRPRASAWPSDRGLVLEIGKPEKCLGYHALRTPRFLYTEYRKAVGEECEAGVQELYDLRRDPFQLENRLGIRTVDPADEARAARLSERLAELNECSGIEGRDPATSEPFCE